MSFGQEIKDFVAAYQKSESNNNEGIRARAYRDAVDKQGKDKEEWTKTPDGLKSIGDLLSGKAFGRGADQSAPTQRTAVDLTEQDPNAAPKKADFDDDAEPAKAAAIPASRGVQVASNDPNFAPSGDREAELAKYRAPPSNGNDVFRQALGRTLQFEGGYVANDAGKGPTNFGINSSANPGVDVKNMSVDDAAKIYRTKYWSAIDGDSLAQKNPDLAKVAFDTAVNHGPGKARELISESGGDANKFLDLRAQTYRDLIDNDPGKFGKYSKSWFGRIDTLRKDINGGGGAPMGPDGMGGGQPMASNGAAPAAAPQAIPTDPGKGGGGSDNTPEGLKMRSRDERYRNAYAGLGLGQVPTPGTMMFEEGGFVDAPLTNDDFDDKDSGPGMGTGLLQSLGGGLQSASKAQGEKKDDGRSAKDRYADGYAGLGLGTTHFEEGGFVDRQEDLRVARDPGDGSTFQPQQALPTGNAPQAPVPTAPDGTAMPQRPVEYGGRPAEASAAAPADQEPRGLAGALHGGLTFLQNVFGLKGDGAIPGDKTAALGQQRLANGEGAATKQEIASAEKAVDPDGRLDPVKRQLATLTAGYMHYLENGDVAKAQKYAAAYVQYAQLQSKMLGDKAYNALRKGDQEGATKALQEGHDTIPDGTKTTVKGKSYAVHDVVTGQQVAAGEITPEFLTAQTFRLKSGAAFWEHIAHAAAGTKAPTAAQQLAQRKYDDKVAAEQGDREKLDGFSTALAGGGGSDPAVAGAPAAPGQPAPGAIPLPPDPSERPASVAPAAAEATPGVPPDVQAEATTPAPAAQEGIPSTPAAAAAAAPAPAPTPAPAPAPTPAPAPVTQQGSPQRRGIEDASEEVEPAPQSRAFSEPEPQMPKAARDMLATMSPKLRKQALAEWEKSETYTKWEQSKADFEKNEKERVTWERGQAAQRATDKRHARTSEDIDKRAATRQQAQLDAEKRRQEDKIAGEERLVKRQQDHELRVKRFENDKPKDFDVSNKEEVGAVENELKDAFSEATKGPDGKAQLLPNDVPNNLGGKQNFRSVRDAAIAIHRFNKVPYDTAAAVTTELFNPGKGYTIAPIEGSVDDRVKITFKDPNNPKPSWVLPRDVADQVDIIRGKLVQLAKGKDESDRAAYAKKEDEAARLQERDEKGVNYLRPIRKGMENAAKGAVKATVNKAAEIIRPEKTGPSAMDTIQKGKGQLGAIPMPDIEKPAWANPFKNPN